MANGQNVSSRQNIDVESWCYFSNWRNRQGGTGIYQAPVKILGQAVNRLFAHLQADEL